MAASTSREPQDEPLPPSPLSTSEKPGKGKGKGKAKEASGQRRRSAAVKASPTSSQPVLPEDPALNWISLTESTPSKASPVFTKDGSYYFALGGSSVKIFATSTGQLVSTLSSPPSNSGASPAALTSIVLNPHNVFQIITGSLDGSIRVWDYLDATLIRTLEIGHLIHHICAHDKHPDFLFVTASRKSKQNKKHASDDNAVVFRISMKATDPSSQEPSEITPVGKTRFPTGLAVSPSGEWLVVTAGHKAYVANLSAIRSGFTKYVSPERLSCLTFHPSEEYFATGDVKGNIRLWYCLNDSAAAKVVGLEKKSQTASFHWHAHAVSSLAFSSNGAYLLSGGEESVLVIWQLHTGKKEFVPRVGAPLQTISVSKTVDGGEEYLLGLTDATYVFVSAATLKISRSYSRIKLAPSDNLSSSKAVPLALHSSSSTFILPSSHPSSVQMFSPSSSKVISELEICPSNRVSRRDEKPIEPSRVERTVVSPTGEWMASIDTRAATEDFQGEVYLKIWRWDPHSSLWTLNTRIDRPHGLHDVLDLSFSPRLERTQESYLVSAGGDGAVKTWRLRTNESKRPSTEEFWTARSSFSFRDETPSQAAWSPDGSLLAVTLGASVVLYDALTNVIRSTFTSPECTRVKGAHFVGRGRWLAVRGDREVVLWDIVSHRVRWSFMSTYPIRNLVPHPDNESFAVFSSAAPTHSRVQEFSPASSIPSRTASLPFALRSIVWYSPKPTFSFNLAGITHDWQFILLGDDVIAPEEEGTSARGVKSRTLPQRKTLFQDIFGKSIFDQSPTEFASAATLQQPAVGGSTTVFDFPAYLAPPVESLFEPLVMGFLKRRTDEQALPPPEEAGDKDVDMDVDVDAAVPLVSASSRIPDDQEISSLIDLFRTHSLHPSTSSQPQSKTPKPNGIAKINGVHREGTPVPAPTRTPSSTPTISRTSQTTKSKAGRQPTPAITPPPSPESEPSPMVNGIGKKRKKASE